MRVRVQVLIEADGDIPPAVHEVAELHRGHLQPDTLGLQLAEPKELLARVQEVVVDEQVRACLAAKVACPHCHQPRRHKDQRSIAMRTLFGTLRLPSPPWHHCYCRPNDRQSFSPLTEVLPERTTPELLYLEAKFTGLMSYGLSAKLLGELLPLGRTLHTTALRRQVQATAQRLEEELGSEQGCSSRAAPGTGRSCRSRTCPSRSASMEAMCTPATSDRGGRDGSRSSPASPCRQRVRPSASGTSRPTTQAEAPPVRGPQGQGMAAN
jgi:hypothetical protein